jgi:hypothetical protein
MTFHTVLIDDDLIGKYDPVKLPCGGVAYLDESSGISYRCELCGATVGSIGQSQHCKDEMAKWDAWEKLGGKGWDYFREPEEIE